MTLFRLWMLLICTGCVPNHASRAPTGGEAPTGDGSSGSETPSGPSPDEGQPPVAAPEDDFCTPLLDVQAKRGLATALGDGRVLWLFDGPIADKGAALSTCVDGKFVIEYFKSFGGPGDVPGMPWLDRGKVYIPYQSSAATNVVVLSQLEGAPATWKVESHPLALGQAVVGSAVVPPEVLLFTEPLPRTLKLYRLRRDLVGALQPAAAQFPAGVHFALSLRRSRDGRWSELHSQGNQVVVSDAANITGPWSAARVIFEDKAAIGCGQATELPMFSRDLGKETVIAYSCSDEPKLKIARVTF